MTYLISEFRSKVQESGTVIFSDDRIQDILDSNQTQLVDSKLYPIPERIDGENNYLRYNSPYSHLEGTATGTANVRIANSNGSVVTNFSEYPRQGYFVFNANTLGTSYYYTGNSYDLNSAIADGWEEKASYYSTQFDFTVEGRGFKKSQIVGQCLNMAQKYRSQSSIGLVPIYRGDML